MDCVLSQHVQKSGASCIRLFEVADSVLPLLPKQMTWSCVASSYLLSFSKLSQRQKFPAKYQLGQEAVTKNTAFQSVLVCPAH